MGFVPVMVAPELGAAPGPVGRPPAARSRSSLRLGIWVECYAAFIRARGETFMVRSVVDIHRSSLSTGTSRWAVPAVVCLWSCGVAARPLILITALGSIFHVRAS